jgi:hypothetical protein
MLPKRISVKFFAQNPEVVDVAAFTPVLQRWIQETRGEGLLIDVVDYKHMHEGPGIILIGDEGDYSYDLRDGRPGVMYVLKRYDEDTLQGILQTSFRRVLDAALQLETEGSLNGLRFNYGEAKIEFLDRLNYPNTAESLKALHSELQSFVDSRFGSTVKIEPAHDDPRETFAVKLSAEQATSGAQLAERVAAPVAEA